MSDLFVKTNPADRSDVVWQGTLQSADDLVAASRIARVAQRGWVGVPAPVRGRVIAQVGRLVEANKGTLAALVTREIGKPYTEAMGEVQEVIDTCDFFLGEGRRLYGQTVPSEMPDKQLFTFRVPVGVVAVITAGNFPTAVPAWYLVPALLCGNAVVWKPAETANAVAEALVALFHAGGVPSEVLQLVRMDGPTTATGLRLAVEEGVVDKVGFTGSTEVGRTIGRLCGEHLQTPCLELGGKNPMLVMADAELDLAVEGALFSGFGTAGQRCTSLGTVWVQRPAYQEFKEKYVRAVEDAVIGDPTQSVLYGPMIDQRFLDQFERWLGLIQPHHSIHGSTGIGRITDTNPRKGFVGDPETGWYAHPTVVEGVSKDDELYGTETFGPLVGLGVFDDLTEAIDLANGHGYGLSASIYTTDPNAVWRFREASSAGMLSVNNSTSGAEAHLPFGGNGKSGNGSRQSGMWVIDQFTRWQSMNWDYSGRLQKAQMDTAELTWDADFRL
ncbi:MAG TPA: aldehyde dehydrogenase family protein [Actinomycetes bacterium]|nr:aldehyde dehydrogenase family protein [Actinomycetes bacterium]